MGLFDPTGRFSSRVRAYVDARPRYPRELVTLIERETGLARDGVVADIGSGTGFSSEPFLATGRKVIGVEPNRAMRDAAEELLATYPSFVSFDGTAEQTGLPDHSVDLVIAGQAFHWFDVARAREEFRRILRPPWPVVLFWNARQRDSTPFLRAYEALLEKYGTDYLEVRARTDGLHQAGEDRISAIERFFDGGVQRHVLSNAQVLNFEALEGRLLSSSYTPLPEDARYQPMLQELTRIFDEHQVDGTVTMLYDLEVYIGQLSSPS